MSEQTRIEELIRQNKRLNEEVFELKIINDELEDENRDLSNDVSELEKSFKIINTNRDGGILYKCSNLLDCQLMEALEELITHKNNVTLLQTLQGLSKLCV
jgi:hypothetical protein